MNDGITRAVLNTGLSVAGAASAPQIKLLELPASLQKQSVITGEVVANQDGKITLKTPQGLVVFEADVNVAVGQKISLKLQVVMQNAQKALLVELTTVTGQPIKPSVPQPAPQPTVAQPTAAPLAFVEPDRAPEVRPPQALQNVPALPDDPFAEYPLLQAKIVQLPRTVSPEALKILLNEILNFPPQNPLPPTLQEGLEKIRQLLPLLTQAMLASQTMPPQADISEQNVILSLMQLIKSAPAADERSQPTLASWPTQNMPLLQTVPPGEGLTKDMMTALLTQLQMPQPVKEGVQKPEIMPMAALVLGQKNMPSLPAGTAPTLLLGFLPETQQALIFVTAMQKSPQQTPLLPGTVLVMNTPPMQQATAMELPFSALLSTAAMANIVPLHPGIGDTWPALQELWTEVLGQTMLADVAATMRQTLPSPVAQQLPAAALFFLAALRQGVPSAWFGDAAIDKLQHQHAEKLALISQLGRDMQAIRGAMSDNTGDVWRPLPMPLQVGAELVRMQWFYRHQYEDLPSGYTPEEEADNKKRRKTRFILDVPQTRIGDLQIDGLMHEKNLDLILRTENTLPSAMENAIRDRYYQALETSGIVGGILFQAGRREYVQV